MGRTLRLHQPGAAFHIVSRTQGHLPLFDDGCKDAIANTLLTGVVSAGAKPIAFAVMDNHFHLIVLQGTAPLGWTMQPILQRVALLMQRRHKIQGHVFERRFRSKCCHDAEYLPNAIVYVHRNPVKANIVLQPCNYRWSSAACYEGKAPPGFIAVAEGLQAFDPNGSGAFLSQQDAYIDRINAARHDDEEDYWDWYFRPRYGRRQTSVPATPHASRKALRDIRDVAVDILRTINRDIDVEIVRSRYGGRDVVAVRKQLICSLIQRGYAGVAIAKYLRVSEATVSLLRSAMRWSSIPDINVGQH